MTVKSTFELMGEAVLRAREHWRRPRLDEKFELPPAQSKSVTPACTIAISRESGAGGTVIAREVGHLLDWIVYDRELLERIAEEAGLRSELLENLDEKRSHWLTEALETFGGAGTMSGTNYARHLAETLLGLAARGQCVIVGRGATVVLPANTSLRVRLVAALDDRVQRIRERLRVSESEAAKYVRQKDAEREGFVKDYFRHANGDAHGYDLVINTSRFSIQQSARLIVEAVRQFQQGPC